VSSRALDAARGRVSIAPRAWIVMACPTLEA
jgi:hypothetical protein